MYSLTRFDCIYIYIYIYIYMYVCICISNYIPVCERAKENLGIYGSYNLGNNYQVLRVILVLMQLLPIQSTN